MKPSHTLDCNSPDFHGVGANLNLVVKMDFVLDRVSEKQMFSANTSALPYQLPFQQSSQFIFIDLPPTPCSTHAGSVAKQTTKTKISHSVQ